MKSLKSVVVALTERVAKSRPEGDIRLQAGDPLGSVFNMFNIFGTPSN